MMLKNRNGVIKMPRKKPELSNREKSILKFIEKQIMTVGYPPSVREIGKAVGLSSTATVHGYLANLLHHQFHRNEYQLAFHIFELIQNKFLKIRPNIHA